MTEGTVVMTAPEKAKAMAPVSAAGPLSACRRRKNHVSVPEVRMSRRMYAFRTMLPAPSSTTSSAGGKRYAGHIDANDGPPPPT